MVSLVFEITVALFIVFCFSLRTSSVQTKVANYFADYLSEELGVEVQIGKFSIKLLDNLEFKDVYIQDQKGDTLLFAKEIYADIQSYDLDKNNFKFGSIGFVNANFGLKKYKDSTSFNFQFLTDYFRSDRKESTKPGFTASANTVRIINSKFEYLDENKLKKSFGVDYSDLKAIQLNANFSHLSYDGMLTEANIDKISFKEKSGFDLTYLTASARFSGKEIMLDNLGIKTPKTNISSDYLSFNYNEVGDMKQWVKKVSMLSHIYKSKIHTEDLSYFVPYFEGLNEELMLEGIVNGPIADLTVNKLDLNFGESSYLKGDVKIVGLPHMDSTKFNVNLNQFNLKRNDLANLDKPPFNEKNGKLIPKNILDMGDVRGNLEFNGYISDFDAKSNLFTQKGDIATNIHMKRDPVLNDYRYSGWVGLDEVNLGQLSGSKDLGVISAHVNIDSKGAGFKDPSAKIDAKLDKFVYAGATYINIDVDGVYENKSFVGDFTINDPKINAVFSGVVDVGNNPVYDFTAEVVNADLYALGLVPEEKAATISTMATVKGTGELIDLFNGTIFLDKIHYANQVNGKQYELDYVRLESESNDNEHNLLIESKFFEASLNGKFLVSSIPGELYALGGNVLPSIFPGADLIPIESDDFSFWLDVHDLGLMTELFFPDFTVSEGAILNGSYNTGVHDLMLSSNADWIAFKDYKLENMHFETDRFFDVYEFQLRGTKLHLTDSIVLDNVSVLSQAFDDNIDARIKWGSENSDYEGNIFGDGYWTQNAKFYFDIQDLGHQVPSHISVYDETWNIPEQAHFSVDSSAVFVSNFMFENVASNPTQSLKLHGKISEDPTDRLFLDVKEFQLENISGLATNNKVKMEGRVNGNGEFSGIYQELLYDNDLTISDFKLNDEYFGDVITETYYVRDKKEIQFIGNLERDDKSIFDYVGAYKLGEELDNLDFDFKFNDFDLTVINGFIPKGISYFVGKTDGLVGLEGSVDDLRFDGTMHFEDAGCKIDLLNTSYTFSGEIEILPDEILMFNIPIKDKNGAVARLEIGSFYHQNFQDYGYNFAMGISEPFLVMNTDYSMNQLYHGNAYITGDMGVSYDNYNELEINVFAKSEKGTNLTLPLYGAEEIVMHDFVTFVDRDDTVTVEEEKVDLTGIHMTFDLELTPDAEIELVFDEVVGDKMSANGSGNLTMEIDEFSDFSMYGQYEINEAEYLFTLMDFINKPFNVKQGGTISWYGDPYKADINLQAFYQTTTSLYDIMPEGDREQYKNNTKVNCLMNLSNDLFNPEIHFGIELPRSDENARTILKNLISSEEELNKQVFAIMVLNKFLPRTDAISGASSSVGGSAALATTSDLLSSQLSNWLNQISDDVDISLNTKFGGDAVSEDEIAVALSTQFLNDRLVLSGNFGVANGGTVEDNSQHSRLIGDVNIEYKLNSDGSFRVRAFNESNEYDPLRNQSFYTQGVGVYYKTSFDTFNELMRNVFRPNNK